MARIRNDLSSSATAAFTRLGIRGRRGHPSWAVAASFKTLRNGKVILRLEQGSFDIICAMFKKLSPFVVVVILLVGVRLSVMQCSSVFDPSEARYAAIAANMSRSGDYLVPRFIHEGVFQSFDGKPPLLFQAGGIFCSLLGENEFAVRLPSFLAAVILLGILYFAVKEVSGREAARRAIAICGTSVAFYALAGFCMTDMLLALSIAGALLLEGVFNLKPSKLLSICIFGLLGLGMLIKGPIAVVLFGFPTFLDACLNKRWKVLSQHCWGWGPFLFFAICAPWYVAMERETPGFLSYFFIHENFLRFLIHEYGDKYGAGREFFRGMAIIWFVVVTLPWTLFVRIHRPFINYKHLDLWTISILAITFFWCLTSRIPLAYMIPVVPLFAAVLARNIDARQFCRGAWLSAIVAPVVLVGTLTTASLTSNKLPGPFMKAVKKTLAPNERVTFAERKFYSPEFYLGRALVPAKEVPKEGLVLARRKFLKKCPKDVTIRLEDKNWVLLEMGGEKK